MMTVSPDAAGALVLVLALALAALAELPEPEALELAEFPPQDAKPNASTTPRAATTIAANFLLFLIFDILSPSLRAAQAASIDDSIQY